MTVVTEENMVTVVIVVPWNKAKQNVKVKL
jgi:hypothetical protein